MGRRKKGVSEDKITAKCFKVLLIPREGSSSRHLTHPVKAKRSEKTSLGWIVPFAGLCPMLQLRFIHFRSNLQIDIPGHGFHHSHLGSIKKLEMSF